MKRLLVGLVALLFLGAGIAAPVFAQKKLVRKGRYFWGEIVRKGPMEKSGTLKITEFKGDVRVVGWDQNRYEIHEKIKMDIFSRSEAEKGLALAENSITFSHKEIKIDGNNYRSWMVATVEIKVPKNFNTRVGTRGGDILLRHLKGNQMVKTSGGDIDLQYLKGKVQANTSGGDILARHVMGELFVSTSGGDLHLEHISGRMSGNTSGGDIFVRDCEDMVHVATSGGDVSVFNVKGPLDAVTSGGDIDVRDALGRVSIRTSGGDLKVEHAAKEVHALTSGGDIDVVDAAEKVSARSMGGDISLRNVHGPISALTSGGEIDIRAAWSTVDAKTSGGNVWVEMVPTDYAKPHWAKVYSIGGDLTLIIPGNMPATISAEIKVHNHRLNKFHIESDFPLKIEKVKESDRVKAIRATGDISGGGDTLYLRTVNGNIEIKKK